MYGGSGKLGRGGGGGGGGGRGGRRSLSAFPPPPPPPAHRASAPAGRLSVGGGAAPRNRTSTTSISTASVAAAPAVEESFSLVTGNPLAFAAIIRLAPDLVDEIKRVESQGGTPRIKFGSNANPAGNVIQVDGKDFRFTWSREFGDLCDIYEERQSGEDGNGLLVESGCAWRKVNVQRVLDESTKKHVKMRSEEAERKLKSRKAIVLEHGNPSMKSQMKAMAAVEVNPWRMGFKQKKEAAFKKRKIEPPQVGLPLKSVHKSGPSTTASAKGRPSISPLPSPPDQSGVLASPYGTGNLSKGHAIVEDTMPAQVLSKENAASLDKEIPSKVASVAAREKLGRKGNLGATPMDLQSMLISFLTENPKGMSLKALEKAIGDTIPNSVKKIEPIIKKIATFQAPGRYFLKPGVELESFKKPSSESGSSPEDNHHQTPAIEDNHVQRPVPKPSSVEKASTNELQEQAQLNSKLGEVPYSVENMDVHQHSPDLFGDKRISDNSEGQAGSSSYSGSDSDSESDSSDSGSDSGSHSRSRSKSRSPVGTGSGSSSDSESDASSNSKEGSDEDVDIMTSDDDKESRPILQTSEPAFSSLPIPWKTPDGGPVQNGIDGKDDSHLSDDVEIENDLPADEPETEVAVITDLDPCKVGETPVEGIKHFSPNQYEHRERQLFVENLFDDREGPGKEDVMHNQSDTMEKSYKDKSKRGSDMKHSDEKTEHSKRSKSGNTVPPMNSGISDAHFIDDPYDLSPDRHIEGSYNVPIVNRSERNGNAGSSVQKKYNHSNPGKSISDSQQSGRKSVDRIAQAKAPESAERPGKHFEGLGHVAKHSERIPRAHEGFPMQKDKVFRETQDEDGYANEKKFSKNFREGAAGDKHSISSEIGKVLLETNFRKHELLGKFKEARQVVNRMDADKSPVVNGKGNILRRELSDLELGELREPLPEETPGVRKQLERKGSFKHSDNRPSTNDNWNLDSSKGKPVAKASLDSRKMSPSMGASNPVSLSKRKTPEHHVEDLIRPQHRVVQPQPQQFLRVDHAEIGPQFNKLADANGKFRQHEAGGGQETGMEEYGETHKRVPVSQPHDSKRGLTPHSARENKMQKSTTLADMGDRQKDSFSMEINNSSQKRRESSSDESSCPYSKYDKEEPELKGPIKDFSQYKEYVQEYREKYDSYCSLNRILESYRNEFRKLERDLEIANGRDMDRYYDILSQLNESYRQCGTRHKRLKKIFIVLHEELKQLKQRIKDYAVAYTRD
ncbi:uncharacterized protein LOC131164775 [Malania oleifera]|uniref:uncharacterized protein LOC131164775 n=1 Tax=Malania oleifera TaxID=397392 RepID=UPI0025AE9694|nr:uncharacterized protein LOC131164775 [Malania oleifera]